MNETDAQLISRCLQGYTDVYEELVVRHQDAVFNLALRMTRSRAEADDLAQDAFIQAFHKLRQYKPEHSFRNWVMTICANRARNRFRAEARRRVTEQTHLDLAPEGGDVRDSSKWERVEAALRELPDPLRAPLVLRHMEGLSYDEIGHVLGIGISAAKMRVMRARDALLQLLGCGSGGTES